MRRFRGTYANRGNGTEISSSDAGKNANNDTNAPRAKAGCISFTGEKEAAFV